MPLFKTGELFSGTTDQLAVMLLLVLPQLSHGIYLQ